MRTIILFTEPLYIKLSKFIVEIGIDVNWIDGLSLMKRQHFRVAEALELIVLTVLYVADSIIGD